MADVTLVSASIDQRSTGGAAPFTFNEDVSASSSTSDFQLWNLTTGRVVPTADFTIATDASAKRVTLSWPALETGEWRLTLLANSLVGAATAGTNPQATQWSGTIIRATDGPDQVTISSDLFIEARFAGTPATAAADVRFPLQVVDFGLLDMRGGDDRVVTPPIRFRLRVSGGSGIDIVAHTCVGGTTQLNDIAIHDQYSTTFTRFAHDSVEQFDATPSAPMYPPPFLVSSGGFSPGITTTRVPGPSFGSTITVSDGTARFAASQGSRDPLVLVRASNGRFEFTGTASVGRLELVVSGGRPSGAATTSIAFLTGVQHVFALNGIETSATGGFLDIGNAAFISQVGTPAIFNGHVKAALQSSGNGGVGSTASTGPNQVVGVAPASAIAGTTFPKPYAGYSLQGAEIVSRLTLRGDANLDRVVNFDDLLRLAANYNATGRLWHQGDFNYDGTVNFDDLLLLAANYNQSLAGHAPPAVGAMTFPPPGVGGSPVPRGAWAFSAPPVDDPDNGDDSAGVLA